MSMIFLPTLLLTVSTVSSRSSFNNATCEICDCSVAGAVDCSNRNLTSIPKDINASTIMLNMSSNYLQGIEKGIFKNLSNLKVLDLYKTYLKSENVAGDAFEGLDSLTVLNIAQNDQLPLTNVSTPENFFEYTPNLKVLRMYGTTGTYNSMHAHPGRQLSKLLYLEELWTDGFTNLEFGQEFRNMSSLKILHLAGDLIEPSWRSKEFCSMTLRDGMLDNLVSISHLYVTKCGIHNVDGKPYEMLEKLEYLDLSKNKIQNISRLFDSFCSLSNTTTSLILNNIVSKSSNCGTIITRNMVKCLENKSVRELQLNHNRIQAIETTALSALPKTLQIVHASKNEFYLGFYIFDVYFMTNLTYLDISYQFFSDSSSIWHEKNYGQQYDLVEEFNGNAEDHTRENNDVSKINGNANIRHKAKYINDHEDKLREEHFELQSDQSGSEFQSFIETYFTAISYIDALKYKINEGESSAEKTICPQPRKDRYIPPGTVKANIPPNLKSLDISRSKHASPIFQFFINESNSLKEIDASYSLLYCWEGPVHGLNRLELLDLSMNFCNNVSNTFFQRVSSLKTLNISFNFLSVSIGKDEKGQILSNLTALEILDISFNRILAIPRLFLKSQTKLKKLFVQGNLLEKFDVDISHMTQLQSLVLRMNKFNSLSEGTCNNLEKIALQTSKNANKSLVVDLRNNSIECSCQNLRFMRWIYDHFRSNTSLVVKISSCKAYENQEIKRFESRETLRKIVEDFESQCRSFLSIIIGVSVTGVLIINVCLGVLVHKFRWKLQYWYYVVFDNRCIRSGRREGYEPLDDPRYKYDVFVASSEDRKEFVIDKLRSVFKDNGLTAFIPVYHINFNERVIGICGKAINESKVVMFVFSDEWSSDYSMNVATHMWQCDILKRRKPTVLGIYLDKIKGADVEKVKEICCQTFIDYPGDNDRNAEMTFWRDCVHTIKELGDEN